MTEESKGLKSLPFDGTDKNYPMWKKKCLSLCHYKQCGHILTTDLPSGMPEATEELDETQPNDQPYILLRKANTLAFSMLTLSCQAETTMNILDSAVTKIVPWTQQ